MMKTPKTPAAEDAPLQHMKPEPPKASKAAKAPVAHKANSPQSVSPLSPEERLVHARQKFLDAVAILQTDPGNQPIRNKASIARANYRTLEAKLKAPKAELPEIPAHPNPKTIHGPTKKPTTRRPEEAVAVAPAPEAALLGVPVEVDPAMPKDEIRFEAEGQEVGRLVNIAAPEAAQADVYPHHAGPVSEQDASRDLREILHQVDPNSSFEEVLTQIETDMAAAAESEEVHHPAHYTAGRIECIDAMREALGDENFVAYCRGAAIKYVWRAGLKGDARIDLEKAAWYCRRAAEVLAEGQLDASIAKAG